ncbi:hypothetical protein OS493_033629 [Desmophyllum pertusum]|uniref:Uncharacterized protein n=1 Tax=Desmophyllum pertusum TaxID=174260 RepID=A0A9X0CK40_9CNID|nr:hypothetical protein OS493_033629 [Desmophyllum pertusum]
MELKLLIAAVLFLGVCAGFYLPEEQKKYKAPELDEAETDLEDPLIGYQPPCRRGARKWCFDAKLCGTLIPKNICRCIPFRRNDEDETEFDDQMNDEMIETPEDQTEEFDETIQELEDPSTG